MCMEMFVCMCINLSGLKFFRFVRVVAKPLCNAAVLHIKERIYYHSRFFEKEMARSHVKSMLSDAPIPWTRKSHDVSDWPGNILAIRPVIQKIKWEKAKRIEPKTTKFVIEKMWNRETSAE